MLSSELRQQIDSLWDKFWSNGMPEHMAALKHINYLVFMRYLEDFENVRIIRDKESITGDYAKINTLTESYKVTSNNTNKVKVLLKEKEDE